jgi:hypothetical protein
MLVENFIGKKFGRLTVLEEVEPTKNKDGKMIITYRCHCDCGTDIIIERPRLQGSRSIKSCGCLSIEQRSKLGLSKRKLPPDLASGMNVYKGNYADGDLTFEDFLILSQNNCFYCAVSPNNSHNTYINNTTNKHSQFAKDNGTFVYSGLDRVDPDEVAHNRGNVVPCCFQCNRSKSNMTIDEFGQWIVRIYNFWSQKNK